MFRRSVRRMAAMNPYTVLGLSEAATEQDVKAAHKKYVKRYHPDAPEGGNPEQFRKVQAAYEELEQRGFKPPTSSPFEEQKQWWKADEAKDGETPRPTGQYVSGDELWKVKAVLAGCALFVPLYLVFFYATRDDARIKAANDAVRSGEIQGVRHRPHHRPPTEGAEGAQPSTPPPPPPPPPSQPGMPGAVPDNFASQPPPSWNPAAFQAPPMDGAGSYTVSGGGPAVDPLAR